MTKHKLKDRGLYLRVHEEKHLYVADFFSEDDGTFVADWAVLPKGTVTNVEEFVAACEAYAFFL